MAVANFIDLDGGRLLLAEAVGVTALVQGALSDRGQTLIIQLRSGEVQQELVSL